MLPALFFIIGVILIYPAVLIAGKTGLGAARPILSIGYVTLFFLFIYESLQLMIRRPPEIKNEEPMPKRRKRRR